MRECRYDEKQKADRGKVFQYSFFVALAMQPVFYILEECVGVRFDEFCKLLICIWVPLTVCMVLMIAKDAYDEVNSQSGKVAMLIIGAVGLFLIGCNCLDATRRSKLILPDGMVSEGAGMVFEGICMVIISITYIINQCQNKRKYKEE